MTNFHSKTMNLNINSAVAYLTFKRLEKYSFLNHAFSTRLGGVSSGHFRSMNLSFKSEDERKNVQENQKLFCEATGFSENTLVKPIMTHGKKIGVAKMMNMGSGGERASDFPDTDGLITNESNVTLVTSHADCPSIFILDPQKRAIGLVHAGWRGTVQEIAKEAVSKLSSEYGCNSGDMICCIGPSICAGCFTVKMDVVEKFRQINFSDIDNVITKNQDEFHINLYEANKQILMNSGIKEENIVIADICTMCNKDLLFSHRATAGKRGGMLAMMSLR